MSVIIPLFPTKLLRYSNAPLRRVLLSNTLTNALQLQKRHPFELVALPPMTQWERLNEENELWLPKLCARTSILYPFRSFDIIQYTDCRHMLVGNVLMRFDEGRHIVGHERVILDSET